MKETDEKGALLRLTTLCSQAEHCSWEMTEKMRKWGIDEAAQARIMAYLLKERFVDDTRYCRAFVREKIKYNKWGPRKIVQALFAKHIGPETYRPVLDEINPEDYLSVLRPLLQNKRKTLRGLNEYEQNGRLVRFAMSRGFTFDLIRQCLDVTDALIDEEDD